MEREDPIATALTANISLSTNRTTLTPASPPAPVGEEEGEVRGDDARYQISSRAPTLHIKLKDNAVVREQAQQGREVRGVERKHEARRKRSGHAREALFS